MKFLIQKINGEIRHDFSFTLMESIRFRNWLQTQIKSSIVFLTQVKMQQILNLKSLHKHYVPVGSVEFVSAFLKQFYDLTPRPVNIPLELLRYADRHIFNGTELYFPHCGKSFIKSNDKIKGICGIFNQDEAIKLPAGNYQFSEIVSIDSEWRAFVYDGKLVGLQNYAGEFTKFPYVDIIKDMIKVYNRTNSLYT